MRLRVLLPLLVFGLLAVCAILLPAGGAIADARTQQLQLQRQGSVDQIALRAAAAIEDGELAALDRYLERFHDVYGESVLVVDGAGEVVAAVGGLELDGEAAALVLAASRGLPQWSLPAVRPWSPDTALVAEPLASTGDVSFGAVVLAVDQAAAKRDVTAGWALVGAVGLAALIALLAASFAWTRWVLRPVFALDAAANAIAERREFEPTGASGPPELRRLADSFERMASSMADALEQQRGLVADASHQLRNPLAAIRLRVDSLPREDDSEELEAVERDLDRLERTVDRMLVLANAEHRATAEASGQGDDLDDAAPPECIASADALVEPHRAALAEAGLAVETVGGEERVACRESDLEEIVEILLDNARKYAGRGARVRVGVTPGPGGREVTLEIADSGEGLADDELTHLGTRFWRSPAHRDRPGTGLGLAIVEQLARANRATVEIGRAPEGGLRVRVGMRAA